uniref:Uncharacterized protein n=1 Tax=Rhizophora mucronata TaxID=61149 RepID=A0A2P2IHN0_RHIMU
MLFKPRKLQKPKNLIVHQMQLTKLRAAYTEKKTKQKFRNPIPDTNLHVHKHESNKLAGRCEAFAYMKFPRIKQVELKLFQPLQKGKKKSLITESITLSLYSPSSLIKP